MESTTRIFYCDHAGCKSWCELPHSIIEGEENTANALAVRGWKTRAVKKVGENKKIFQHLCPSHGDIWGGVMMADGDEVVK